MSMMYNIGNPDSGLRQAQKCGCIKPVNWSMLAKNSPKSFTAMNCIYLMYI